MGDNVGIRTSSTIGPSSILEGRPIDETAEATLRRTARDKGRAAAAAWLLDETVKIRTEHTESLIELLNRLHERCIVRIRTAISEGYAESEILISRASNSGNVRMAARPDDFLNEVADLRSDQVTSSGISEAFSMLDSTRHQAVNILSRNLRTKMRRARSRAQIIEGDTAAAYLIDYRLTQRSNPISVAFRETRTTVNIEEGEESPVRES